LPPILISALLAAVDCPRLIVFGACCTPCHLGRVHVKHSSALSHAPERWQRRAGSSIVGRASEWAGIRRKSPTLFYQCSLSQREPERNDTYESQNDSPRADRSQKPLFPANQILALSTSGAGNVGSLS